MTRHLFQVLREPRAAADVEAVLQQYAGSIAAARARKTVTAAASTSSSSDGRHQTGALLLSVVGAKLSEGINFGNELGRCVVVVGMPYPNPADAELRERMAFIDGQAAAASTRQQGGAELGERMAFIDSKAAAASTEKHGGGRADLGAFTGKSKGACSCLY